MDFQYCATALRFLCADMVETSKSGHPGMPLGMADVATVLFSKFLRFNPNDPHWANRDRFVLSAGHGSALLYGLLHLTGYKDCTLDELKRFRQLGSKTAGHPEYGFLEGVETTTGPLGQGFANAVGMAMAERLLHGETDGVIDHHTYVMLGDGCLMEGISHEAASFAGHQCLNKLIVLFDDNGISIDGPTSLATSDDHIQRFASYGFDTLSVDGHDYGAILKSLETAKQSNKPTFIAFKTQIGKGAPGKENTNGVHGSPLGADTLSAMRESLNWRHDPFAISDSILSQWRNAWRHNEDHYTSSLKCEKSLSKDLQNRLKNDFAMAPKSVLKTFKKECIQNKSKKATRQWSQDVLTILTEHYPHLLGGSADLTPSNNTKTPSTTPISKDQSNGRYIHYGVREHAMGAIMNGISLHGGYIPFGGTFFAFLDYLKPALRLSSIMHQGVIYIMTHDSIGLGEDGPTHQPVEQLAMLRAQPNVCVLRPCDGIETAESFEIALKNRDKPTVIVLSRQGLPHMRKNSDDNMTSHGAYGLEGPDDADITLIASGSEVHLAHDVYEKLMQSGTSARVVSMPSMDLFQTQPKNIQNKILGSKKRVVIEAGSTFGWGTFLRDGDICIGMDTFGASAPILDLYEKFGFTADQILQKIMTS